MIVDVHAHFYPEEFLALLDRHGTEQGASLGRDPDGTRYLRFEGIRYYAYTSAFTYIHHRLATMDAAGVDVHILSLGPPMVYWAEPAAGLVMSEAVNDAYAALARAHPTRFAAMASVPLQDPDLACKELERAVRRLGHRGVAIGTNVAGVPLHDERLQPFFARVEELDVPCFVHPLNPRCGGALHQYRLDVSLGFPMETLVTIGQLIFGGVLDRFPRLRLVFSHMGGGWPFLAERVQVTYESFPHAGAACRSAPREYLSRLYFDTVVYSRAALLTGLLTVGAGRLLYGSDAPFFGENVARTVQDVAGFDLIPETERKAILGGNARALYGL